MSQPRPGNKYVLSRKLAGWPKGTLVDFMWWETGHERCHCNVVGVPAYDDAISVNPKYLKEPSKT